MGAGNLNPLIRGTGALGSTVLMILFAFDFGRSVGIHRWWFAAVPETIGAFSPFRQRANGIHAAVFGGTFVRTARRHEMLRYLDARNH